MIQQRNRFPYEWCVAISAAVLIAILPWAPSIPFSSVLAAWLRWITNPLPGLHFVGTYDGFVAAFLPFFGALSLSHPLLAFCDQVLERPRYFVPVARTIAALMIILSGMAIADQTLTLGTSWEFAQIGVSCGIGVLLVMFAIRLHRNYVLPPAIRMLSVTLLIAGACIASFVLLPAGLLALFVAYIALAIALARREPIHTHPTEAR